MLSVNNNSAAQSILSNLTSVEKSMNNSYQQLSTGNRVSSAADDPSSYAISQQMTSQVNGLNQATQNAQNGISMIQTATGAMNQIEQVLQTMSTLSTEASNAGNTFSDRANLQLEMNALAQQINSTTNQTQYNGINLLSGQFGNTGATGQSTITLQVGANQGQTMSFNINATDAETLGVGTGNTDGIATVNAQQMGSATLGDTLGTNYLFAATVSDASNTQGIFAGNPIASAVTASSSSLLQGGMSLQLTFSATYDSTGNLTGGSLQLQDSAGNDIGAATTLSATDISTGGTFTIGDSATGATLSINLSAGLASSVDGSGAAGTTSVTDQFLLDSSTSGSTQPTNGNNWSAASNVNGINIMTQAGAQKAIQSIQNAISTLSSSQAQLGAVQNRLNYTVSNLSNSSQNLQNAQSTITNTDMASAYTNFSQQQVLEQVGISMLGQAQQQPQMILKLMQ